MKHLVIFLGMVTGVIFVQLCTDKDWDEAFRIVLVMGVAIFTCYCLT